MRCGDFKENYIKDEEIFQSRFVKFWLALFFLFLIVFPFIANAHMLYIANMIGFAVIGAIGLNLLTGFTGQISLGHAAFIGVGAYTSAILVTKYGISFWLSIPLAGLLSALAGLVIGIASLRVKGLYLCIATLAAQFIFGFIFVHWESMTKGITGVAGTVEAVGPEVHHVQPGVFVAAETHIACGQCATCRTGRAHICQNLRILGVDTDGAFAEFVVIPAANAWIVGEGIHPDAASIMEPFGNAVHAAFGTEGGEDLLTNPVAVIGCGPIGLFAVGIARALGAWKVIAVEPNEHRRAMAVTMGADLVVDPVAEDPDAVALEEQLPGCPVGGCSLCPAAI